MALDRLAVGADDRAGVDEGLVLRAPGGRRDRPARAEERDPLEDVGAPGVTTSSAGAKTWSLETAATEIASGAVPGEPTEPWPKSSRSLPAEITGTTPAAATLWIASTSASFAGSTCGPPPEKLSTSMPSATEASNAATISGV